MVSFSLRSKIHRSRNTTWNRRHAFACAATMQNPHRTWVTIHTSSVRPPSSAKKKKKKKKKDRISLSPRQCNRYGYKYHAPRPFQAVHAFLRPLLLNYSNRR
ncbi:hypothetical protein ABW19_dt0204464 [Dactylella cylindrospora]|nr:hypothetical protein ABW19_dt0204464 [Dactylella cylindrospora]